MPDLLDFMIINASKYENKYQSIIIEYPIDVQYTLKLFLQYWPLPKNIIPSSKERGTFSRWIKELRLIKATCSEYDLETVFRKADIMYKSESNTFLKNPGAIHYIFVKVVMDMNKEAQEKMAQIEENNNKKDLDEMSEEEKFKWAEEQKKLSRKKRMLDDE